jgi:hypothetical protein
VSEIDLVASAGGLDPVVAALREFIHRCGALRAVAVTPDPMVDSARMHPIEVTTQGATVALPHAIELDVDDPIAVPDVLQPPPFEVDPDALEVRSRSACSRRWAAPSGRWPPPSVRTSS